MYAHNGQKTCGQAILCEQKVDELYPTDDCNWLVDHRVISGLTNNTFDHFPNIQDHLEKWFYFLEREVCDQNTFCYLSVRKKIL